MSFKTYKIICKECEGNRKIQIHETPAGGRVDWLENESPINTPIVSARERLDGNWGFQCTCGNNDLLTTQERIGWVNPAAPTPKEINEVVKNLKIEQPKFKMVVL